MIKTLKTLLLVTVLAFSLSLVWLIRSVRAPLHRVDVAKRILASVNVGSTTKSEFELTLRQNGLPPLVCDHPDECHFTITEHNAILSKLHLAPLTYIGMGLQFKSGLANRIFLISEIAEGEYGRKAFVMVEQTDTVGLHCSGQIGHGCIDRQIKGLPAYEIVMDKEIERDKRDRAFDINAGCLSKIGGCKNSRELLPHMD